MVKGISNFETILSSLPDYIFEVAGDGSILYINRSQTYGDVRGRTIFEFLLPEYHEAAKQAIQVVLRTGSPAEFRNRGAGPKGAGIRVYQNRICLLKRERGNPTVLFSATDVTAFMRFESQLDESKQRLNFVLESNQIGTWEYDLNSNALFWDEQMYALHGVTRQQYSNAQDAWAFTTPKDEQDRSQALGFDAMKVGKDLDHVSRVVWPTGETRHIRSRGRMARVTETPPRFVGICWDVTRETRLQDELEIQKLKAIHAAKMATLGEMAGGISHEINNPLMIIQGYGSHLKELALSGTRMAPDKLLVYAEKFMTTTARIATIIRGLKSFARISTNDPFTTVPIGQIVADTMTLCRSRLQSMAILAEIVVPVNFDVQCRPVAISQALLNLIGNSADAIHGLEERWVRIQAERDPAKNQLILTVTDSGRGIVSQVAEKIMEPFYTTKPQGEGVGLGLSISAGLVESHGGRLYLDCASPNTRFVIELPLKQDHDRGM